MLMHSWNVTPAVSNLSYTYTQHHEEINTENICLEPILDSLCLGHESWVIQLNLELPTVLKGMKPIL